MVFALAAKTNTWDVAVENQPAYGFWCAGLDTERFPLIGDKDRLLYQHLPARTCVSKAFQ